MQRVPGPEVRVLRIREKFIEDLRRATQLAERAIVRPDIVVQRDSNPDSGQLVVFIVPGFDKQQAVQSEVERRRVPAVDCRHRAAE